MPDGGVKWRLALGAFGIKVNPLAIFGGFGERVDARLRDEQPVGDADLRADERLQFL